MMQQLVTSALALLWAKYGTGFVVATAIWILYRQRRYANALSVRQQQREVHLLNETWRTALETVLHEQPRRLRDLVEDTENDSSLRP
mgnify:CR=1 FL=1